MFFGLTNKFLNHKQAPRLGGQTNQLRRRSREIRERERLEVEKKRARVEQNLEV